MCEISGIARVRISSIQRIQKPKSITAIIQIVWFVEEKSVVLAKADIGVVLTISGRFIKHGE